VVFLPVSAFIYRVSHHVLVVGKPISQSMSWSNAEVYSMLLDWTRPARVRCGHRSRRRWPMSSTALCYFDDARKSQMGSA